MTHWLKREALWAALTLSSHVVGRLQVLHAHVLDAVIQMRKEAMREDMQPEPKPGKLIEDLKDAEVEIRMPGLYDPSSLPDDGEPN